MKQQVILNFLNLPGIVGLGLIDGHSRPYFSGIDRSLNFQQKEALTQGIQQVISTTPPGFESFDFRFAQKDAWIYKLSTGVILLVVTNSQLDTIVYNDTVNRLKETLESDPHSAVSTFRLLAGSTTLNHPNESPAPEPAPPESLTTSASPEASALQSSIAASDQKQWEIYLITLNALTDATARYLGKIVVANTWRNTCPQSVDLKILQVDRSGHFSLSTESQVTAAMPVDDDIHSLINQWVHAFVKRCSMIIRDYREMVIDASLTSEQTQLFQLLPDK
ncbi:MAG: hypothetical protein ACFBSG_06610 [Leptolyngbyaceae cyanobacterium]